MLTKHYEEIAVLQAARRIWFKKRIMCFNRGDITHVIRHYKERNLKLRYSLPKEALLAPLHAYRISCMEKHVEDAPLHKL